MIRPVPIFLVLAAAASLFGCANATTTTIRVSGFDEVEVDAGEILYSNPRPADGAAPEFQCCEANTKAKPPRPRDIKVVNRTLGQAPNQTCEIIINLMIPLELDCTLVDRKPPCIGTFSQINITRNPALRPVGGGANLQPVRSKVWWTITEGDCDGQHYKGKVNVVYIAAYAKAGVPAVVAGVKEWVGLDFIAGRGVAPPNGGEAPRKGTDYHMDVELDQSNAERAPAGSVKEDGWRELPE